LDTGLAGLPGSKVRKKKNLTGGSLMEDYTFSVEWKEDTQKFIAKCFEYPCLIWSAETEDKAIAGIKNITTAVESQFVSYLYAQ
jgi:hypothetical protein